NTKHIYMAYFFLAFFHKYTLDYQNNSFLKSFQKTRHSLSLSFFGRLFYIVINKTSFYSPILLLYLLKADVSSLFFCISFDYRLIERLLHFVTPMNNFVSIVYLLILHTLVKQDKAYLYKVYP